MSGNNRKAILNEYTYQDPQWVNNPWTTVRDLGVRFEGEELKTGVWHITKIGLDEVGTVITDPLPILFQCMWSQWKSYYSKFGIWITTPEGKTWDNSGYFYMSDGETLIAHTILHEGYNEIDLTESKYISNNITSSWWFRLRIPSSFYNHDSEGNLLTTATDFYIVFFPVWDTYQDNTLGTYTTNFNDWSINASASDVNISTDGLSVTYTGSGWGVQKQVEPYYVDENVFISHPQNFAFLKSNNSAFIVENRRLLNSDTQRLNQHSIIRNGAYYEYTGEVFTYNNQELDMPRTLFYFEFPGTYTIRPYQPELHIPRYKIHTTQIIDVQNSDGSDLIGENYQTLLVDFSNLYLGPTSVFVNENAQAIALNYVGFRPNSNKDAEPNMTFEKCFNDNINGVTYLNGQRNNQIESYDILGQRNCGAVMSNEVNPDSNNVVSICSYINLDNQRECGFSGRLYKVMAFKEKLTTWQINYLIKKYKFK